MKRKGTVALCIAAVICVVPLAVGFAGNGSGGGSGSGGSGGTGQTDRLRDQVQSPDRMQGQDAACAAQQDQTRDRKQSRDPDGVQIQDRDRDRIQSDDGVGETAFVSTDGRRHEWRERYTARAKKYDEMQDAAALKEYLYRIANRYRFQHQQDLERFMRWALENRPWTL